MNLYWKPQFGTYKENFVTVTNVDEGKEICLKHVTA